jgi:tetratricopeptide (TPR) repeat protein
MATNIASRMRVTLLDSAGEPLVRRPTENLDAYHLYLRGRFFLNQRGEGVVKGLEAFEQTLALDPNLALAHAGMAEAYALFGFYGLAPSREVMPKARLAAERAIAIDRSLAEPHGALQVVSWAYDRDWTASEREFNTAMAKGPNTVSPMHFRALELAQVHGRIEEALAIGHRALEVDPLSPYSQVAIATVLVCGRRFTEACESSDRALELVPGMWQALRLKGISLAYMRQQEQSLIWLERAVAASHGHPWCLWNIADVLAMAGRTEESRLKAREILRLGEQRYIQPTIAAVSAFYADGLEAAIPWLDRAAAERDSVLPMMNHHPGTPELKRHPRWQATMRSIGLIPSEPSD